MTRPEVLAKLRSLRPEFENAQASGNVRKMEVIFRLVRLYAMEDDSTLIRCIRCNQYLLDIQSNMPVGEGHIYSYNGLQEARMSRMCEWCFDITLAFEPDDLSFYPTPKFRRDWNLIHETHKYSEEI